VACPFCLHFSVDNFVYVGVVFFLVCLNEGVDQSLELFFCSGLVDGFGFCFLEGFVYGLLFALYPFSVFLEGLFWVLGFG